MKRYVLKNWCIVTNNDPYTAPEHKKPRLNGDVHGHPHFREGENVTTSSIVGKTFAGCFLVRTKSGSLYEIAATDVNPKYEQAFPGARERLLNSLPEVAV